MKLKFSIFPFLLIFGLAFAFSIQAQLPIGTIRKPIVTDTNGNVVSTPITFSNQVSMVPVPTGPLHLVRYLDFTNSSVLLSAITNLQVTAPLYTTGGTSPTLTWSNDDGYATISVTNGLASLTYVTSQGYVTQAVTNGILSSANIYADGATNAAVAASNSYADSQIGQATNASVVTSKAYTDGATNNVLVLANGYTDGATNNVLVLANGYTDSATNDLWTTTVKPYVDGSTNDLWITVVKPYTDSATNAVQQYMIGYTDGSTNTLVTGSTIWSGTSNTFLGDFYLSSRPFGAIPYSGIGGIVSNDYLNFFWNTNNLALSLGTNGTEAAKLHVKGSGIATNLPLALLQGTDTRNADYLQVQGTNGVLLAGIDKFGNLYSQSMQISRGMPMTVIPGGTSAVTNYQTFYQHLGRAGMSNEVCVIRNVDACKFDRSDFLAGQWLQIYNVDEAVSVLHTNASVWRTNLVINATNSWFVRVCNTNAAAWRGSAAIDFELWRK